MFDDIRLRPPCANEPDLAFFRWSNRYYQGTGIWHLSDEECREMMRRGQQPETIAQRNARLNLTNWRPRAEDIP